MSSSSSRESFSSPSLMGMAAKLVKCFIDGIDQSFLKKSSINKNPGPVWLSSLAGIATKLIGGTSNFGVGMSSSSTLAVSKSLYAAKKEVKLR